MMENKTYSVFGLTIESGLELPELIVAEGSADVTIGYGTVPEHIAAPVETTPWYELAPGKFLLRVNGIAKYYAENGKRIIIEPQTTATKEDVRVFLLNTVFAALLQQRDYLVLHGAAVVINGKAVVIAGPSATGKTTIALKLYDSGCKLLTDEICAIRIINDRATVFPGVPQLNVWRDTLQRAEKNINDYQPLRQGLEKYTVPGKFCTQPVELARIILLQNHNLLTILTEEISGGKKLIRLLENACFAETAADKTKYFRMCVATDSARITQLAFNVGLYPLAELAEIIMKEG
ncbi:MAG: hypothetical protein WCP79_05270 [Bacillota bacterium]